MSSAAKFVRLGSTYFNLNHIAKVNPYESFKSGRWVVGVYVNHNVFEVGDFKTEEDVHEYIHNKLIRANENDNEGTKS